jgi:hypothetical protein
MTARRRKSQRSLYNDDETLEALGVVRSAFIREQEARIDEYRRQFYELLEKVQEGRE